MAQASISNAPPAALSAELVAALSKQRREPRWLRDVRIAAWRAFERLPMPTPTTEGWRRTDIRALRLDSVSPLAEPLPAVKERRNLPSPVKGALAVEKGAAELVQQDTSTIHCQLPKDLQRQGVLLMDLGQAVREREALVREHLASVVSATEDKFPALHAALWNGGVLIYVPRGVAVEVPLHVVHYYTRPNLGAFTHVLIVADAGSEVTVLDEYLSAGRTGQGLAAGVVEVIARPNARVRYVQLQEWGLEQWTFSTLRARVERDASVSWLVVGLGGALTKSSVESRLVGSGGQTELVGLVFGDGRQHFDHYTLQSHEASNTRSELLFKAVLHDRASSNYTGMIHIAQPAAGCAASQESRNLLLSKGAKADADPRLEILNSDVIRATHAASVGPVDQEMLFYVMSRGLSRAEAERLLVQAFFGPILARIPLEPLRKKLWTLIERRLGVASDRAAA